MCGIDLFPPLSRHIDFDNIFWSLEELRAESLDGIHPGKPD